MDFTKRNPSVSFRLRNELNDVARAQALNAIAYVIGVSDITIPKSKTGKHGIVLAEDADIVGVTVKVSEIQGVENATLEADDINIAIDRTNSRQPAP